MNRLLAVAVAVAALAAAAPASADPQHYDNNRGYQDGRGYHDSRGSDYRGDPRGDVHRFSRDDLARLQARIDWGVRSGNLNRHEARRLYWQLSDLRDRSRYYWRTDGISWRERQDLDARFDRLSFEVRRQIRDDDRGRGGYDRDYRDYRR